MAGRHEPASRGSFYVSLATAGLRFALVIAAVVLGIFVLTRAFPTASERTPQGQEPTAAPSPSPSPMTSPTQAQPTPTEEAVTLRGVTVEIQNGTSTTGLAAETADKLKKDLGVRIAKIGNASRDYEATTIFFQQGSREEARELRRAFFGGNAELERTSGDTAAEAQLVVVLGMDYAESQA